MTVVHWARHGENVASLSRTFSCRVFDGDLTDRGIAQARLLAGRLHAAANRYELLVCSPQRRARQTAQILSAALGLPVAAELDDLCEVNVGELDGRADDSAWQVYKATLAAWRSGQLSQRFPGGESADEPRDSRRCHAVGNLRSRRRADRTDHLGLTTPPLLPREAKPASQHHKMRALAHN